jgi:hypothetical protein
MPPASPGRALPQVDFTVLWFHLRESRAMRQLATIRSLHVANRPCGMLSGGPPISLAHLVASVLRSIFIESQNACGRHSRIGHARYMDPEKSLKFKATRYIV